MKCYFYENIDCEKGFECSGCCYLPSDEDKINGKAKPQSIIWAYGYDGSIYPECPACGEMPYNLNRCFFCGQKFIRDERVIEWEKPPELIEEDCFICGGKGTMKGYRAKSNGHFHGRCVKCGARICE